MLIDEKGIKEAEFEIERDAYLYDGVFKLEQLKNGVYLAEYCSPGAEFLNNYTYATDVNITCCGLCDGFQQILSKCPEIEQSTREFIIILEKITRESQPRHDGFRFNNFGTYIGDKVITENYLYDQKNIDEIFIYNLYCRVE